jgi:hypothetical protein
MGPGLLTAFEEILGFLHAIDPFGGSLLVLPGRDIVVHDNFIYAFGAAFVTCHG